jgi:hypothetical protein
MSLMMVVAWFIGRIAPGAVGFGVLRCAWHRALFVFAV